MKEKIFKILTVVSLFGLALSVNATDSATLDSVETGSNSTNADAVVGTVETPVYTVAVIWNDLTFDWVYDEDTNEFGWAPAPHCNQISSERENVEGAINSGKAVYKDNTCSERVYSYSDEVTQYFESIHPEAIGIGIEDLSENGQIVPSIKWTSSEKYNDVTAKFTYKGKTCIALETEEVFNVAKENTTIYSDSNCSTVTEATAFETGKYYALTTKDFDLETEEIPDAGRTSVMGGDCINGICFDQNINGELDPLSQYLLGFKLEGGTTVPTAGDVIGTLTVSIRAK